LQVSQTVIGSNSVGHFQTFQYLSTTLTVKGMSFYVVLRGWRERTGHVLP
jgi:hypothetical protein